MRMYWILQTDLVGFNMNLFTHPVDLIEFFEWVKEFFGLLMIRAHAKGDYCKIHMLDN